MFFKGKKNISLEDPSVCTGILILLHGAVMLGILFFCDVKYEVSDDFVMELIASGAINGTPNAHLMFCSYIWGQFLNALYGIWPQVSWYFFAQTAVCFGSCCAISYYLAHTKRFSMCVLLTVMIAAFFSRDMYLLPQFTKTAAVAIAGGGCLFVWSLFHKKGRDCTFSGAALVICGCLLRHNAIYVTGVYLVLYVLWESFCLFQKDRCGFRKKILRVYGAGTILVFVILALRWCNHMAYESEKDYKYYMDYSYARALTVDYPLPDYSVCQKELEEIGISENDYSLIVSWSFGDQTVFSLERMEQVLEIVNKYRPTPCPSFKDLLKRFFGRGILNYPGTWCCVMLAGIGAFLCAKTLVIAVLAGFSTISMMLYFISIGHSVYRVEFGYLFAAALLLIYTFTEENLTDKNKKISGVLYVLALAASIVQVPGYLPDRSYEGLTDDEYRSYIDSTFDWSWDYLPEKYTKTVNKRDIRPNFFKEIKEHPQNLYLLDFNTTIQSMYFEFAPYECVPEKMFENMIYLGGVTVNHPVIKEALKKRGIKNELPGLLKENVYFVSNTTNKEVQNFLREHYDAGVKMTFYKELDGYQIWSYQPSAS